MSEVSDALRNHLVNVLDWEDAHVGFDKATDGIPPASQGTRAEGFPHSPWELLEHLRLAQDDIVDFCVNASYQHTMAWPADYWPASPEPPTRTAWQESVAGYVKGRDALKDIARSVDDLAKPVPTGSPTQTYLRAILLAADHAAYHVGQIVLVRRALGHWPH